MVTGAAGLLGQALVAKLIENNVVEAIDIAESPFESHPNIGYEKLDLLDFESARPLFEEFNPDIIFNCAAYTDVDGCETNKTLAYELNVGLVERLMTIPFGRIVQFSTDYVFDGEGGPYSETDETSPVGYYGQSKLESESIIRASGRDHLVIRTNVLFGRGKNIRPNFITWLIDMFRKKKKLRIVVDQFNNPTYAANLAEAAIEAGESAIDGILHVGGDSYLSRYEIAIKTAGHFGFDKGLVTPITTEELGQTAKRPLRGGLRIDLAKSRLKTKLLTFDEALHLMNRL